MRFIQLKLWAYLLYSAPVIAPSWYFMENFSPLPGMALSVISGMIVMHFIITEDNPENHKQNRWLMMRKRHFID